MKRSAIFAVMLIIIMSVITEKITAQCVQCDANSSASGNYASALGMSSNAAGQASLAAGLEALADGSFSLALGKYVSAYGANSVTIGRYLQTNTSPAMIIGTGYDNDDKLCNGISNSLMIGFNSSKSTLFVGGAIGNGYTGKIGIGDITNPQAKLHIKADYLEAAELFLEPDQFGVSNGATLWLGTKEYGIRARYGRLEFKVGNDGRYLFSDGYVGIGTTNPVAELQVNGDIFIEKDNAGLVLKSPDGQCWKITVNNTGELATTSINCNLTTDIEAKTPVENNIRIFPNPTSGELTIEAEQELSYGRVSIFSMEGRQLYSEPLHGITATIDLSHLQPGVYIVNVEGEGRIIKSQQVVLK